MKRYIDKFFSLLLILVIMLCQLNAAVVETHSYLPEGDYQNTFGAYPPPAYDYHFEDVLIEPADPANWGVECWVNVDAFPGSGQSPEEVFVSIGSELYLEIYGPTGDYRAMAHVPGVTLIQGGPSFNENTNSWVHLVVVVNNGMLELYTGTDPFGVVDLDNSTSVGSIFPGRGFTIGCARNASGNFFNGAKAQILGVRVFEFQSGQFDPETDLLRNPYPVCYAFQPQPPVGSLVSSEEDRMLSWKADEDASCGTRTGFRVYFDPNEMNLETDGYQGEVTGNQFFVSADELDYDTTYYWRIDSIYEVNGEPNIVSGDIWSFSTAPVPAFTVRAFYDMEGNDPNVLADVSGHGKDMNKFYGASGDPDSTYFTPETAMLEDGATTGSQSLYLGGYEAFIIEEALTSNNDFVIECYTKPVSDVPAYAILANVGGYNNGMGLGAAINGDLNWGALVGGVAWLSTIEGRDINNWVHLALIKGKGFNEGKFTILLNHEIIYEVVALPVEPDALSFIGAIKAPSGYAVSLYKGYIDNVRFSTFNGVFSLDNLLPPTKVTPWCGQPGQEYDAMDFNHDCYVDLHDFTLIASQWLMCTDPLNQANCDSWNGN